MKKRVVVVVNYLLILLIVMSLYLCDGCLVLAREGLSDAELYGNGQESILYQNSSKKKNSPSRNQKADTQGADSDSSEAKKGKEQDYDSVETKAEKETDSDSSKVKAEKKKLIPDEEDSIGDSSGNALTEAAISGDAFIKEEDIIITGVHPNSIYNRDVTIEISAVKPNGPLSVLAELCKVSDGQNVDNEKSENTEKSENMEKSEDITSGEGTLADKEFAEETTDEYWTDEIDHDRSRQLGLQIGLSATGQLISGKQQVSEEGRYELVVWQEANGEQKLQLAEEQKILKSLYFTVDKTAPVIDRELINRLCENRIDIGEICRRAVRDESKVTTNCYVNEQQLSEGVIKRPGEYELIVKAEDEAGNQVQEQLQITLQDEEGNSKKQSRFMTPSVIVLLFGGSLLLWEKRKEKKEDEYEQRDK